MIVKHLASIHFTVFNLGVLSKQRIHIGSSSSYSKSSCSFVFFSRMKTFRIFIWKQELNNFFSILPLPIYQINLSSVFFPKISVLNLIDFFSKVGVYFTALPVFIFVSVNFYNFLTVILQIWNLSSGFCNDSAFVNSTQHNKNQFREIWTIEFYISFL